MKVERLEISLFGPMQGHTQTLQVVGGGARLKLGVRAEAPNHETMSPRHFATWMTGLS
tara:strand:+ start:12887 stop:13060 length:174 start_codon:yes stop_codon:yes gene_type:complete